MRVRDVIYTFVAVGILLTTPIGCVASQEDPQPVSIRERKDAQQAARRFVKRMQQTRDTALLINELFVPNFISHFVSGDCECISQSLYSRLGRTERLRWFVALTNFSYLTTLDVLYGPDRNPADENYLASTFKSILPDGIAEKLQKLIPQENDFQFKDYRTFHSLLVALEKVLVEARAHLSKQAIEQTPAFQRELRDSVTNTDIGYRVRAYIGGGNVKDCEPLVGFPTKKKFYRVETPLMMGVILVKDNKQMKIIRITHVDGD